jgi:hypothetical protein
MLELSKMFVCSHDSETTPAVKVIPNQDTFNYVHAEWVLDSLKEIQIRKATGSSTNLDRLVLELLRSSFK